METNIQAIKNMKTMTITTVSIAAVVSVILTILFAVVVIQGMQDGALFTSVVNLAKSGSTSDAVTDKGLVAIGAGISAVGLIGSGMGQGYAAGKAAEAVGRNPEAEGQIRNMMIIGAAIAESAALYALVIGIMCLFVA